MRAARGQNTDCEGEGRRLEGVKMAAARAGGGGLHGDAAGEGGWGVSSGTLPCRLPHAPARCRPDRGRRRHAREQCPDRPPIA